MQSNWKVLIADDEPIIREGIRDSVLWNELQMEVIAEAEDGEEALELSIAHNIDILLVDINMPIMNGLTLIKHVRQVLPHCKIIIITGHDEFSYAQEAIRLNVNDYLLKPANPSQLRQLLSKISSELKELIGQKEYIEMASNQINKNLGILKEQFCHDWIKGKITQEEIYKQLEFLQFPFSCPIQVGVIQMPSFDSKGLSINGEAENQLMMFSIYNIVSEIVQPYETFILHDYSDSLLLIIWDEISNEAVDLIQVTIKNYFKISIRLHFELFHGEITHLKHMYEHCKKIVDVDAKITPIVRRARQYIKENFSDPDITLETLSEYVKVSPVYLSRIIKKELGMSFVGLVTNMRINKAIRLLHTTEFTMLEIAEAIGYDSQHYFSTAFKKATGMSPKQFRISSGGTTSRNV